MYKLEIRPLAKTDLIAIWRYSFDKWGEEQADKYLAQLDTGLQGLIDNPQLGQAREKIRAGYRSIQIHRHVIYYRLTGNNIDIVRVLHERMIPQKHL